MMQFSDDPHVAEQQMHAIIFYLTAFGYIDGNFSLAEKQFIRDYIRNLVADRVGQMNLADPSQTRDFVNQYAAHFHGVADRIDYEIRNLFTEVVAQGEDLDRFVYQKLKLHAFEIFKAFDEGSQRLLLLSVDELISADGVNHPAEEKFREEVFALLHSQVPSFGYAPQPQQAAQGTGATLRMNPPITMPARMANHSFFEELERHFTREPEQLRRQVDHDMGLVNQTMAILQRQREAGAGKLSGKKSVADVAGQGQFMDGVAAVFAPRPGQEVELVVLGDLHGSYTCLKAALAQSDFFRKVHAHWGDPTRHPDVKLVLLGDYIDRGIFSFSGVLRGALSLFAALPENVYVLRGNHEWYVEVAGRIRSGVAPAESVANVEGLLPREMLDAYRRLFDALPHSLLFDRTLFVHAGIPRDDTIANRWVDLSSLNDNEIKFQMMWSDPAQADYVPLELQRENARFPFGRMQFRKFMSLLGCNTLVRGHEKVEEGFKAIYDDGDMLLLNLFSAGGMRNEDFPADSSYRHVRPMALTVHYKDGVQSATPWEIDYQRYQGPDQNAFFRGMSELAFRG
jgi:hypothetical protein